MTNKEKELAAETYLEEQPLDEEDKELVETVYDRLEIFEELNRPYHDMAKLCRRVLRQDDPEQDDPETVAKTGKRMLQVQTLKSTINNTVADQMASMPEAKILPETPDMQDVADDLQDLVHQVIYGANNYEQTHYRRAEDFYTVGTAITQVAWDEDMQWGKGEVAIVRWPLEAFLWDPTADNIQECRAVMKVGWHPLSWYVEHYPEAGRYVASERGTHNNVGMTAGQEEADHPGDESRALMIEYWWREYDAAKHRYTVNVACCAGGALLEKQKNVYAHGMYPFVIDVHDSIEGSVAGEGLVKELTPMMRYINRYRSYVDMNLRMSSKGRLLMRKGSGIDREAFADMSQDIVEGDRIQQGEDWNWIQNAPFNSMITNEVNQLQLDLKQDSGANQFTRGETTGGIVSGKAINSLIQQGGKVGNMRTEQLTYGSKQIVEQIVWLIAQFYDDQRVALVTGRNGQRRQIKIDKERMFGKKFKGAVPPPPFSVQIEISTRDPQRIANQNQMFMEAYTMSAQAQQFFPLSSLFQILNLDGKDKILPVIQANEHYQQQMQQMQQQIQQMGQQMEGLQKENDNLKQNNTRMANTMATMSARRKGKAAQQAPQGGTPQPGPQGLPPGMGGQPPEGEAAMAALGGGAPAGPMM